MTAGRDLDALVAEKVMGLKPGIDFGQQAAHTWHLTTTGEVEEWAWEDQDAWHHGPVCKFCGSTPCAEHPDQDCGVDQYDQDCGVDQYDDPCIKDVPAYSTDISAAWPIFETVLAPQFYCLGKGGTPPMWEVFMCGQDGTDDWLADRCDTAPLAICVAALRAVGADVPA